MYQLINDLRRLSPPPAEAIAKRDEQVRVIINALGHKYRLSDSIQRKTK